MLFDRVSPDAIIPSWIHQLNRPGCFLSLCLGGILLELLIDMFIVIFEYILDPLPRLFMSSPASIVYGLAWWHQISALSRAESLSSPGKLWKSCRWHHPWIVKVSLCEWKFKGASLSFVVSQISGVKPNKCRNKSKTRLRNARPRVNHGFFDLWSRVYTADKDSETNKRFWGARYHCVNAVDDDGVVIWCHLYPLECLCNKYSNELTHVDPVFAHWSTKVFRKGSWISLSAASKTWMSPRSAKFGSAVEPHRFHRFTRKHHRAAQWRGNRSAAPPQPRSRLWGAQHSPPSHGPQT